MKKIMVISLGGSQIFKNNELNIKFLKKFKKLINKNKSKYKFVVVCGGGDIARIYIKGLRKLGAKDKLQDFAGISVTRTNARVVSYLFGQDQISGVPHKINEVKTLIKKQDVVFCGALEYVHNQTTDSTAVEIAIALKSEFVNITNVAGLYTSNPKINKKAKFIPKITWKEFHKIATKMKFKPGQHFVLDQKSSKMIMDNKIKTYIIGENLKNLGKILSGKSFKGTEISK